MELLKLYEQLLSSLGLKIDTKGLIYKANFDDPELIEYCTIGNKKLCMLPKQLKELIHSNDYLYFHPLEENCGEEVSVLHQWLSNEISSYLSQLIIKVICSCVKITAIPVTIENDQDKIFYNLFKKHTSKSYLLDKQLIPSCSDVKEINKRLNYIGNPDILKFLTLSNTKPDDPTFISCTTTYWNGFEAIIKKNNNFFEILREYQIHLYFILSFIFDDDYMTKYERVSNSAYAQHFQSLMLSYISIAKKLNEKINLVNSVCKSKEEILKPINIDFAFFIANLNQYRKKIDSIKRTNNIEAPPKTPIAPQPQVSKPVKHDKTITPNRFDEDKIKWLKTNPRACYWFWINVLFYKPPANTKISEEFYSIYRVEKNIVGHNDRYKQVKIFFEFSNKHNEFIANYIYLKNIWDNVLITYDSPFDWLKNKANEETRLWVIKYFEKTLLLTKEHTNLTIENQQKKKNQKAIYLVDNITLEKLEKAYVILRCDKYLPLDVLVDSIEANITDIREPLLKQINNAWRQRKNRQKNSANSQKTAKSKQLDKNPFILTPDQETYENLELLSEVNERTIDEELRVLVAEGIKRA